MSKSPRQAALNSLYYGDNLDVLRRKVASNSVDLCYIDPPFNSKRNYFQIYNNIGGEADRAQSQAFVDTWEWGTEAIAGIKYIMDVANLQNGKLTVQTVELIRGLHKVLGEGDLFAYLVHMTLRIVEIHRVLKDTGSFFLHCDPTASHYLKLICDGIFCGQGGDFKNEIVWHYLKWSVAQRQFVSNHDTILFYTKSDSKERVFNTLYMERSPSTKKRFGNAKIVSSHADDGTRLPSQMEEADSVGVALDDVWDISRVPPIKMLFPTQKPEALLERIIRASTEKDDVVLDAYCGCGTTVMVAQELKRRWIGIDITYQSISLILKRLEDKYPNQWTATSGNLLLDGVPRDIASAVALANRQDDKTRKEFEKWAVLTYSQNQARINDKKGADAGIDGIAYFMISSTENGKVIFQVKSGGAQRNTIATLNSDRQREKAEIGILITMDAPSAPMRKEVTSAGKYKHPMLNRDDDRIQIVTVEEILAGKRIALPMGRSDTVKSAEAVGDSNEQLKLV